jgi:flotillin
MYDFTLIAISFFVFFVFFTIVFLASRYRRCPSNQILVVYGKTVGNQSARCYHGGGTFVWPLIQDHAYLQLTPKTIHIPLKGALSLQNIRINVPSTFTIAIDTAPESMNNAAIRLLGLDSGSIESMATEIIIGQLRLTVASLRIEEINQDREKFLGLIRHNIEPELQKVGLLLINVNITDITDEACYIESIGKKAASRAINQAKVDVAEQEKQGEIGKATAEKERRIQVARLTAHSVEGENKSKADIAEYNAELAEREADSTKRSQVAQQNAEAEIQSAKALAENKRLKTDEIVPQEIHKQRIEIEAEANANRVRKEAQGEADALLYVKEAEAEGTRKVLAAKSQGYESLVRACGNSKDAGTMLLIEKLDKLVKMQTEAISKLKIDKITVWDSGSNGEKGGTTANFVSSLVKSLPALHDIAGMAGMELPSYLGNVNPPLNANGSDSPPKSEMAGGVSEN